MPRVGTPRCPRPRCKGVLFEQDGTLICFHCGRAVEGTSVRSKNYPNGQHPKPVQNLGSLSTADLVALFKRLHAVAQRNWQARVAVIGELASRLKGSGRKRCKTVATLVGCSEAYCRQLYKVSQTFSPRQLEEAKAPLSTVIAASYAPQPERLLRQAEVLRLTGTQARQAIHAERPELGYKPGRKPSQEVRACCPECGFEGLMRLVPASVMLTS
jgi:hypothetical protein